MNGSGRFTGVARMTSCLYPEKNFDLWVHDEIWRGIFEVEWIYIKDIHTKFLKNIKLK